MGEQPIFTCKAHVFHIDPKTKRSWLPASSAAVNVSFFYDSSRGLYRIISVEGTKAVINSTITPNMTFTKTSQKFGQWSDVRANTVYGLGFGSELELNKFIEKFHEVKEATRTATKPNGTTPTTSASASPVASRAVNKSAGTAVGVTTGGTTNVEYPPNGGTVGSGIPTLTTNDQNVGGVNVVTHDYNSQQPQQPPPQNQNEINVNNSNVLKAQVAPHQRSQSLSGMQPRTQSLPILAPIVILDRTTSVHSVPGQQAQQDSPKKSIDKGPAPNPPLSGEAQLKYENDRLKLALAQSSANAKKWEVELSTLKNNNARLTSALQESTANVEEWKRQLHSYKEENTRLKVGLIELEAGRGNCDFNALSELRNLKSRIEELESEIRERDEEVRVLKENAQQKLINGEDSDSSKHLQTENETLKKTLEKVQSQLETSLEAQDQQRKVLDAINRQFGDHLNALGELQNELSAVLNT